MNGFEQKTFRKEDTVRFPKNKGFWENSGNNRQLPLNIQTPLHENLEEIRENGGHTRQR